MTKEIFKTRKELLIAFKEVFTSPNGKKVLEQIGENCGKDLSSFNQDPLIMAYRAAKRDAFLEIQELVDFAIVTNHKDKSADSDQKQSLADEDEIDPLT